MTPAAWKGRSTSKTIRQGRLAFPGASGALKPRFSAHCSHQHFCSRCSVVSLLSHFVVFLSAFFSSSFRRSGYPAFRSLGLSGKPEFLFLVLSGLSLVLSIRPSGIASSIELSGQPDLRANRTSGPTSASWWTRGRRW